MPKKPHLSNSLKLHHVPGFFLIFCVVVSLYFLFQLLTPFATALIFAVILAVAFRPLYLFLKRIFRGRQGLASFCTSLVVVLLIVIPFILLLSLLASEVISAYGFIEAKLRSGALDQFLKWENGGFFYDFRQKFFPNLSDPDLQSQIVSTAQAISNFLVAQISGFLTGITSLFLDFIVFLLTLYYLLKDGDILVRKILELSPLPSRYEGSILVKLREMSNAIMYGSFLTAIVQGIFGGIGFALAGIDQAVLWGTAMGFFSFLPYAGTSIIWFPASILLFLNGHSGSALFLFLWGVTAVSASDNFLRPYFISSKTETYPFLMFLTIMGGLFVFGLSGVVFGPVILTFALTFLDIYKKEYGGMLKELDYH
ncbi:MAG: AI-2E family transporter [Patescibacteria group bacterium]